tara:strand:+ start:1427 stop:1936 length:510 start_codon:yes stop_codon:yes gene_type:complete
MKLIHVIIGVVVFVIFTMAAGAKELSRQDMVVASTILAEARGEGRGGMYAVASVISQRSFNRKIAPDKVCHQEKQFSCWNGVPRSHPNFSRFYLYLLDSSKEAEYAIQLAHAVNLSHRTNQSYIDRKRYKYADHYFNPKRANPSWKDKAVVKYKIGRHTFLRLKKNPTK